MRVETKPAWFTANFIATVPDEFIPIEVDPLRRRSSVYEGIAGFRLDEGGEGGVGIGGGSNLRRTTKKPSRSKVANAPEVFEPRRMETKPREHLVNANRAIKAGVSLIYKCYHVSQN